MLCLIMIKLNLDDGDPETIIHVRPLAGCERYKQCKACKKEKSKELMPLAWYPRWWWDWCIPEDEREKKKNRTISDW